jgi:hypothetical protein
MELEVIGGREAVLQHAHAAGQEVRPGSNLAPVRIPPDDRIEDPAEQASFQRALRARDPREHLVQRLSVRQPHGAVVAAAQQARRGPLPRPIRVARLVRVADEALGLGARGHGPGGSRSFLRR